MERKKEIETCVDDLHSFLNRHEEIDRFQVRECLEDWKSKVQLMVRAYEQLLETPSGALEETAQKAVIAALLSQVFFYTEFNRMRREEIDRLTLLLLRPRTQNFFNS